MSPVRQFIGELKRRKVYRVAVVYAVAALGVVEAADLTLPRLGFGDTAVTFVLVLALLGFPIALVLAWAYETTGEGITREEAASPNPPRVRGVYGATLGTLAVVAGVGWWLVWARSGGADDVVPVGPAVRAKSVAVLPFVDLSPTRDQAWFGEGLAEEILSALKRVPDLRVMARQSSFALGDATIPEIAEQLDVTHVLSGSVRTEGDRARIRAELTDTRTQREMWSRDFRPQLTSVLDAQEQIALAVVDAMEVELGAIDEGGLMGASTSNAAAHEDYLRGLQLWNRRSESDLLSAIEHFREAVALDPTYAAAWAGLAYSYLVLPEYSPTADVQRVREQSASAAGRSLEIEPEQPDALTAMGWGRMIHHYDWEGAEEFIARALVVDSTNVNALHWQSHVLSWQGRHSDALALARKATEFDPLSSIIRQNMGAILMDAGEYEEALRELGQVVSADPNFVVSRRAVWNVNTRRGRYEAAADALRTWLLGSGRDPAAVDELAEDFVAMASRFREDGRPGTLARDLVDRVQPGLDVAGQLYAAVGDRETTLEMLEQAYRERAGARNLLSVKTNPLFDFLRDDSRFQEIVNRIGLQD